MQLERLGMHQTVKHCRKAAMLFILGAAMMFASSTAHAAATTLTSVTPSSGPTGGGTFVTIAGANIGTDLSSVKFGSTNATSFSRVSTSSITAIVPASATTGAVTLTIVGSTFGTISSSFSFTYTPTVTSISPSAGALAGGTSVTITGSNFTGLSAVTIGGTTCTSIVVASDTSITCVTPAGVTTLLAVDVVVGTGTLVGGFTYVGLPTITAILPASGSTLGGTSVTITGANIKDVSSVTFGGTPGTSIVGNADNNAVTVVSPSHAAGLVSVVMTTPYGSISSTAFTYVAAPTITGLSDGSAGPLAGGQSLTITGTNLTGASSVTIDGAAGLIVTNTATSIVITTPAGTAAGTVTLTVTNPGGSASTSYIYYDVPSVTLISPNSGLAAGGQTVTITGTGFVNISTILFGTTAATSFSTTSSTSFTCVTPAGTGTVNVKVYCAGGLVTVSKGYFYKSAPTITSVGPISGDTDGFTVVTISGKNLLNASNVYFGGSLATGLVVTDSKVTCLTPAHAAGLVDISLSTPSGSASKSSAYTYAASTGPNNIPTVKSAAVATPNPATVDEKVTFTAAGLDADKKDKLTYAWDFNNGTYAYGTSVSTTFSAIGTYTAVCTISDGKDSITSSVVVTVGKVSVAKAATVKFNFATASKDTFKMTGTINDASFVGFAPLNQVATLSVGSGLVKTFNLDKKGKGKDATKSTISFVAKQTKDKYIKSAVKYTVSLQGDLYSSLSALGFVNTTVLKTAKINVSVPVAIYINGNVYLVQFTAAYYSTAGVSGVGASTK